MSFDRSAWTSWVSAAITFGDFIPVVNESTTVAALSWDTGAAAYKGLSMSQMNELKREIQEAKKLHLSWRSRLFMFILGAPTVFLFAIYGRLDLAMPLMIIIGMHGLVILFKWKLRRQAWFWIAMMVSVALHVPLILFVPWTARWVPALAITVGATADFFLILWILLVVGKLVGGGSEASET